LGEDVAFVDLCHRAVFGVLGALNGTVALENMGLLEEDPVLCVVADGGRTGPVNSVYELTHTLIRLLGLTKNLDLLLSRIAFDGGVVFGTTVSADLLVIISEAIGSTVGCKCLCAGVVGLAVRWACAILGEGNPGVEITP
jgi:hypothetical protein